MSKKHRAKGTPGVRMMDGHEFYLAGRGTKQSCRAQVPSLRRDWRLVRVLPYGYGGGRRDSVAKLADDYGIWVHDETPRVERQRREHLAGEAHRAAQEAERG